MNFVTLSVQFCSAQMATLSRVSQCSKCQTRVDWSKYVERSTLPPLGQNLYGAGYMGYPGFPGMVPGGYGAGMQVGMPSDYGMHPGLLAGLGGISNCEPAAGRPQRDKQQWAGRRPASAG